MRVVGKALAGLDPKTHNAMVAALSKRAAPYERWGPNLSPYPDVVRARIDALQTGDLVLCSSGAGKWVGNAIQVLTDSTWNHVAMVVRGHMTFDEEADQAPHGDDLCINQNFTTPSARFDASTSTPSTRRLLDSVAVPRRSTEPARLRQSTDSLVSTQATTFRATPTSSGSPSIETGRRTIFMWRLMKTRAVRRTYWRPRARAYTSTRTSTTGSSHRRRTRSTRRWR